jgi:outer membrane cobalamin receptor
VILLDGARVDESRMRSLDRAEIERVEVIRGAAAALYSSDPDAVNGVIAIATKRGVAGQP